MLCLGNSNLHRKIIVENNRALYFLLFGHFGYHKRVRQIKILFHRFEKINDLQKQKIVHFDQSQIFVRKTFILNMGISCFKLSFSPKII